MKREEVLGRLGYTVPNKKKKRIIIHSDIKNEADDPFAIMHHLLTPGIEVEGIIAGHFEYYPAVFLPQAAKELGVTVEDMMASGMIDLPAAGTTMEMSYQEGQKLLELAEMDDIPFFRGSRSAITDRNSLPESEGADFIIREARKEDDRPLYIAFMGNITDLAIAYLKEPKIADKVIAIWIAGHKYPNGGFEFNMRQDLEAARIVFESPINIWQVPADTYNTMELSFAELIRNVKPCGKMGEYLCEQMFAFNDKMGKQEGAENRAFPHGETWSIGDNPTLSVLLQNGDRICWHTEKAPYINDDLTYTPNPNGKEIRVYDAVDTRLTISDLFAKLELCYKI